MEILAIFLCVVRLGEQRAKTLSWAGQRLWIEGRGVVKVLSSGGE